MEELKNLSNEDLDLKRVELAKGITSIDKEKARRKLRIVKNVSCLKGRYFRKSNLHGEEVWRLLNITDYDEKSDSLRVEHISYFLTFDKKPLNYRPELIVGSTYLNIWNFAKEYEEITKDEFDKTKNKILSYAEELENNGALLGY